MSSIFWMQGFFSLNTELLHFHFELATKEAFHYHSYFCTISENINGCDVTIQL